MKKIIAIVLFLLLIPSSLSAIQSTNYDLGDVEAIGRYLDTDRDPNLSLALSRIGYSSRRQLVINRVVTVSSDCNIPANIDVRVTSGGRLDRSGGSTDVVFHGKFLYDAPYTCFGDSNSWIKFESGSVQEVCPQLWGAQGDGSTDDVKAFRAAAYSLGATGSRNYNVPFTGSGYILSDEVRFTRGDLNINLNDDITSTNTDANCVFYIKGSPSYDNHIKNIKIIGSKITIDGNGDSYPLGYSSTVKDALRIDYADNVYVEGIHVTNGINCCFSAFHSHNVVVNNCEFSHAYYDNGCSIEYNYLNYIQTDPNRSALAKVINSYSHNNQDAGFTAIDAHHVTFENDTTAENGWYGITSEIVSTSLDMYTLIKNCRSFNDYGGIEVTADEVTIEDFIGYGNALSDPNDLTKRDGIYAYRTQNLRVINSEFSNYGNFGIYLSGYTPTYTTAYIDNCYIHNNGMAGIKGYGVDEVIVNGGKIYSNTDQGVYINNYDSDFNQGEGLVKIIDGLYSDNGASGIWVRYLDEVIISGNRLKDNIATDETNTGGINLYENDASFVTSNRVTYTDPNSNHNYGVYCGGFSAKQLTLCNNDLDGITANVWIDSGISQQPCKSVDGSSTDVKWLMLVKNSANTSDADFGAGIRFKLNLDDYASRWSGVAGCAENAGGSNTGIAFYTATAATPTEKVRISNAGAIGINTTAPDANCSLMEVSSTTKGIIFPRMTTAQKLAITFPVEGLVVYDTDKGKLCVFTDPNWESITSAEP